VSQSRDNRPQAPERTNLVFRQLIEEMLGQLREANANDSWTPEERARAEADLARIMESVRREALRDR
jgi:hypothetical protein